MLEVSNVRRAFGETQALTDCSMSCRGGSVHVLLGENGSGKSTLVKILSGILMPDGGQIRLAGEAVTRFSPRQAQRVGIVSVLQEVLVIDHRSVLDNIFLGYDGFFWRRLPRSERCALAEATLAQLSPDPPSVDATVGSLTLAHRQIVAIARAMVRKPQVLILDEATSALDVATRDVLIQNIEAMKQRGLVVVFISHRMDEVMQLGDVITVLRNGRTVASVDRSQADIETLLTLMSSDQSPRSTSG